MSCWIVAMPMPSSFLRVANVRRPAWLDVPRGYTVVDEVDLFSDRMLERLRAFIDSTELGTIIATTNNLHKLDEPLKDRFRKLLIERPIASDWTARAQAILAAEGVVLSAEQVALLLNGFEGSARQLIEWLEDYTFSLNDEFKGL